MSEVINHNFMREVINYNVMREVINHNVMREVINHNVMREVINYNFMREVMNHNVMRGVINHNVMREVINHNVLMEVTWEPGWPEWDQRGIRKLRFFRSWFLNNHHDMNQPDGSWQSSMKKEGLEDLEEAWLEGL
jgi:hypothetical protein